MNNQDIDLNQPVSLNAFGPGFQQAIIGWCMESPHFLSKCRHSVDPGWFTNVMHQDIIRIIFDTYDLKKGAASSERVPTDAEVITKLNMMFTKPSDLNPRVGEISLCRQAAHAHSFAFISINMTGWIQMIRLKQLVEDANKQFKRKEFDRCIQWVNEKIHEVKKTSFMEDMYVSFKDSVGFLKDYGKVMEADCCTFGHPHMDELLKKGSAYTGKETSDAKVMTICGNAVFNVSALSRGSLMPGDLTVLMGPTNSGKTTTILTIVIQNLLVGKYVGLITHEQDADQIKVKILAGLTRMAPNDVTLTAPNNPEAAAAITSFETLINERLKFIHYAVPGKMFIEELTPIVEQMQEDTSVYRNNHPDEKQRCNKGLDLLVWDYPAKLKSRALGKGSAIWDERTYVYNEVLNLGQTYGFHVIAPVQTNRQGYRVGRGDGANNRVVDVDDVAEGFGIVTIAANVITINRPDNYKRLGIIKFHVAKCRQNETGWSLVVPSLFHQSLAFDLSKQSKTVGPGMDLSEQELIEGFGLSAHVPAAIQAPGQPALTSHQQQAIQAANATRQQNLDAIRGITPSVPPGQPVEPDPNDPPDGSVVSS